MTDLHTENARLRAELVESRTYALALEAELKARAALATPAPDAVQWQPIETAPKDGTQILIYQPLDPRSRNKVTICVCDWRNWEGGWVNSDGEWPNTFAPTHWMPLPAAPAAIRAQGDRL